MNKLALATALLVSLNANAAFISQDGNFGANTLTLDTLTGLQWLDINLTVRQSYDYVATQFGVGGKYEGYRYATYDETEQLFINFGFSLDLMDVGGYSANNFAPAKTLFSFLGSTLQYQSGGSFADGFTSTIVNYDSRLMMNLSTCEASYCGSVLNMARVTASTGSEDQAYQTIGSWLVRTPEVPIPAAAWLFGSGLIGLIGAARRNLTNK